MMRCLRNAIVAGLIVGWFSILAMTQEPSTSEVPRTVEVTPKEVTAEVGQQLKFTAVAKNARAGACTRA